MKLENTISVGLAEYGLNVWEGGCFDLEERLQALKRFGFEGVEVSARDGDDVIRKATLFRRMGMHFSTCSAPETGLAMEWISALGKDYIWLPAQMGNRQVSLEVYCRRSRRFSEICRKWGIRACVHNHIGGRIETQDEMEFLLHACPEVGMVLDTGHLSLAGGDVVEIVRQYHQRIAVLHLKEVFLLGGKDDWGRDRFRFCELGTGNNGFGNQPVIEELLKAGWKGWIYIEQDHHQQDPFVELQQSVNSVKEILNQ